MHGTTESMLEATKGRKEQLQGYNKHPNEYKYQLKGCKEKQKEYQE
jgi:hypothetical protein